jgi:carboxymethylenebutenolidase
MSREQVSIRTKDGDCRAWVFRPDGQGPWPAAIIYMDAPAIRPALFDFGERLAGHGYFTLLPDLFYRDGPYEPTDPSKLFADEAARAAIFAKMGKCVSIEAVKTDTSAFLDFLSGQPDVKGSRVGVTGYCMGGRVSLIAATEFPDRIAAAGAFHPGHLTTDKPDSPHLGAPRIKAKVYVGGADQDAGFTPENRDQLAKAFTDAGVDNRVEIYDGAKHGYTMPDLSVYDAPAAERHWRELVTLFDSTLK